MFSNIGVCMHNNQTLKYQYRKQCKQGEATLHTEHCHNQKLRANTVRFKKIKVSPRARGSCKAGTREGQLNAALTSYEEAIPSFEPITPSCNGAKLV